MLVSIIVPVYNSESYLRACLGSIEAQSFRDFEVLLVDDGSTDSSGQICDEWSVRDSRFKFIHTDNEGVSAARNRGLDLASGDYVFFVDSDDAIVPETLDRLVLAIDSGKYDIAASGYTFIGPDGERDMYISPGQEPSIFTGEDIIRHMLSSGDTVWYTCWNKLIKRRLVDTLRFEHMAQEDFVFCSELYLNTSRIVFLNESLYRYYNREASLSKDISYIGYHNTVPVLWKLYRSVPESRHSIHTFLLKEVFRRALFTSYDIARVSGISPEEVLTHKTLCATILRQIRKELLTDPSIPVKEKLLYILGRLFLWIHR